MQKNYSTGLAYQGKNQAELQTSKEANGFKSDEWMTFCQARERGRKVSKGSKSTKIFCGYRDYEVKGKKGEKEERRGGVWASVFNFEQTEEAKNDKK